MKLFTMFLTISVFFISFAQGATLRCSAKKETLSFQNEFLITNLGQKKIELKIVPEKSEEGFETLEATAEIKINDGLTCTGYVKAIKQQDQEIEVEMLTTSLGGFKSGGAYFQRAAIEFEKNGISCLCFFGK